MTELKPLNPGLAVVIGINKYTNGIPELKNAVNDAEKVAEVLQRKYGYQVLQLLDEAATLSQIKELLAALKKQQIRFKNQTIKIEENDRIFFYFSGHGIAFDGLESAAGPQGFLVPQDGKLREEEQEQSLLPMTDLHDALIGLPSRHLLVILDCCFAGSFRWAGLNKDIDREEKLYWERYERFTNNKAQQVITSAAYDEKALDSIYRLGKRGEIDGHSPFAEVLLKGLNGEADYSKDGAITANELYVYLQSELDKKKVRQTPGICSLKNHEKGEYIFPIPGFNPDDLENAPPLDDNNNPYRGLASFDEIHRGLFFGRQKVIEDLYRGFNDKKKPGLTAVLGASGTGKSSLVKAGLLPRLREDGWYIVNPFRPGKSPFSALAAAMFLTVLTGEVSLVKTRFFESFKTTNYGSDLAWEGFVDIANIFAEILEQYNDQRIVDSLSNFLGKKPTLLTKIAGVGHSNAPEKLLLVIDQFEELVTDCSEEEKDKFLGWLEKILRDNAGKVGVIITLRSDFKAQFSSKLFDETVSQFTVPIMTQDEYREIIEKPAAEKVLYFEPPGLADELINEVVNMPGALPLLSFTLSQLYFRCCDRWRRGERSRALTREDYQKLGGVMGALKRTAMDVFDKLIEEKKAREQTIRDVMLRMVSVSGDELARRRVPMWELVYPEPKNGEVEEVIKTFTDARLLVTGTSSDGEDYVEPAHDALVNGWDKILRWKNQEQESLLLQRRLTPAAMEWKEKQSGRFLWNADPYLDVLKKVLKSDDNWFNEVEEEFVWRSIWQKRRNVRSRWGIATAVIVGLSGLTAAAAVGWRNAVIGQIGNSRQASEAYLSSGQELEAVIEGLRAADTLNHPLLQLLPETQLRDRVRGTLQKVVYAVKERNRLEGHEGAVNTVSFSSDGKRFATAGADGNVCVWDLAGNLLERFPTQQGNIAMVRFSPDDRHLITGHRTTGGEDGILRLWNLKGDWLAEYQATFPFLKGYRISFSKDGQQLAILNNGIAGIWDLQGNLLGKLEGHKGNVTSVTFSPDGSKIATAEVDGSVGLWDSNRKLLTQFTAHEGGVGDLAFSPDSQKLATAGGTFTTRLWDLQGNKLAEFEGPPPASAEGGWINRVMFSPNGQQLATVEERGRVSLAVRLWNVESPGNSMFELPDAQISFSHDSEFVIATPLSGGLPTIWENYWGARQLTELRGDSAPVYDSVFGPTSRHLVTAGFGTVRLWDFSTKEAARLDESNNYVESYRNAVASPDGELLATVEERPQGEEEKVVRLWNSSGEKVAELIGDSPQFSPDSQLIVTRRGFNNTTVFLWSRRGEKLAEFSAENPVIAFSSDSKQIAIGSDDGTVQLWNGQTNTTAELPGIEWYDDHTKRLVFDADGKLFGIHEGYDTKPRLWNLSEGKMIAELEGYNVVLSPKGRLLATEDSSDREGETIVSVWDFSGQQVDSKKFDSVAQIMFSPDGELLAIDANEKTHLWNLSSQQMEQLTGAIASLSPDGSLILTRSPDRIPRLWDWQGNMLAKLEGHTASVNDVMFSVNGDRLITTSQEDGTIRLWDLDGNELAQFSFFKKNVPTVLSFNSRDKVLATEDNNGIAKLWRIEELDELMQRGCNWVRDYYQTNPPNVAESDKKLCDDIANPDPTSK